jgi:hypothetical protein
LDHQLEIETRIHNERILLMDEMKFKYALGAKAQPSHTQNFLPELNTIHYLFRATLAWLLTLEMPLLVLSMSGI